MFIEPYEFLYNQEGIDFDILSTLLTLAMFPQKKKTLAIYK